MCISHHLKRLLFFAVFALSSLSIKAQFTETLFPEDYFPELAQILDSLHDTAPELLLQRTELLAAKHNRGAAFSERLPTVNVEQTLLHRQEFRDEDPKHQVTTQPFTRFTITQPIYHWGAIDATNEIARLNELIKKGAYKEAYRQLLLHVRQLYLNIILKKEGIRVQVNELEILENHYQTNKSNAELGRANEQTLEESAILLEEGKLTMERLQSDLLFFQEEFARITHWKKPIEGGFISAMTPLDSEALQNQPIDSHPFDNQAPPPSVAYTNSQYAKDIEEEHYVIINARFRPRLDFFGHAFRDQVSSAGSDNVDRNVVQGILRISWDIFDGFETKHRRLESKARQRKLQLQAEQLQGSELLESKRLRRTRSLILREISIWERKIKLSEERKKISELNYQSGSTTLSQMMQTINTHNRNQLRLTSLKIDYALNAVRLLSLYGKDTQLAQFN